MRPTRPDDSRPYRVILNPTADRGRAELAWPAVRAVFDESGAPWKLAATTGPGHAVALASEVLSQPTGALVVVGGDGTVNEVVNGLFTDQDEPPRFPIGIVSVGSGNDIVKPLDLPPRSPADAARIVLSGRTRHMDVGRVNERYFVNGIGLGLDGYVALETRGARRLSGTLMYAVALAKTLRRYRNSAVSVAIDDRPPISMEVTMFTVTNGPCHGGGFWICPHASIDDGLFDVCLAEAMGPARVVPLALRVMRGAHVGQPGISFHTGQRISIRCDRPLPAHVDGEILGSALTSLDVEVLPGALRVLVR